jgi:hypothetical protein
MFITIRRLTPALQADQRSRTTHTHTTRCGRCQPDSRPMPPGWVLPVPLFLLLLRLLTVSRWPTPHRSWPQPSDSAGSLSECKCRREQRGEEDQSAEGGSVVKMIQVQKVAVTPAIPAAPSATPCTQTPHTKRVGRRCDDGQEVEAGLVGWSYVPSSCVACANIKKKNRGQM